MLLQLLLRLRQVDPKRVTISVLIVVVAAGAYYLRLQSIELEKARLVYKNPAVRHVVKTVRVAGPVRIRTVIRESPAGERTTEIVEDRGSVVETRGETSESTPMPLDVALAPPRTDRWLVGLGLSNFSPRDAANYTAYAGYGFRNRADLLYGLSSSNDRINQSILFVWRF